MAGHVGARDLSPFFPLQASVSPVDQGLGPPLYPEYEWGFPGLGVIRGLC